MAGFKPTTGTATSGVVNQAAHTLKMTLTGTLGYTNPSHCPSSTDDLGRIYLQWGIGAYTSEAPTENSTGALGFGVYDKFTVPGLVNFFYGGGNVGYSNPAELNADTNYQFRAGVDVYFDDGSPGGAYQCSRYGSQVNFKTDAVTAVAATPTSSAVTSNSANIAANYNANTGVSGCTALLQYKRNVDVGWTDAGVADTAAAGYALQTVSRSISGLVAATLYDVRLVLTRTTNNGTTTTSTTGQFTTLAGQPTIQTNPASARARTTATLNGTVNPNGTATTYWFDYGLTTGYGTSSAAQGPTAGSSPLAYSQAISGLTANTVYHFRAHALQGGVDYLGADSSFTTDTQGHIMPSIYSRFAKYGTATDFYFTVETPSATGSDRILSAPVVWTAGDAQVSKDGAAFGNVSALPTRVGSTGLYKWSATAGELTANDINMLLVHQSTPPSWRDLHLNVQTRLLLGQIDVDSTQIGGNTSAMSLVGVGTGYGLFAKGSSGIAGTAQGTSGHGIIGTGIGPGQGVQGVAGSSGQVSNFFDQGEGAAELTPADLGDNMTFRKILQLLKVREAHKVTQTSSAQVWYRKNSTDALATRVVSDDLTTQTQAKLY